MTITAVYTSLIANVSIAVAHRHDIPSADYSKPILVEVQIISGDFNQTCLKAFLGFHTWECLTTSRLSSSQPMLPSEEESNRPEGG